MISHTPHNTQSQGTSSHNNNTSTNSKINQHHKTNKKVQIQELNNIQQLLTCRDEVNTKQEAPTNNTDTYSCFYIACRTYLLIYLLIPQSQVHAHVLQTFKKNTDIILPCDLHRPSYCFHYQKQTSHMMWCQTDFFGAYLVLPVSNSVDALVACCN